MSVNRVTIVGNLGDDPRIHTFEDGGKVARFNVATSYRWTDRKTGEVREETEWHRIEATGVCADICSNFKKGQKVFIEGRNRTKTFTNREGIERSVTQVIVSHSETFNRKEAEQSGQRAGNQATTQGQNVPGNTGARPQTYATKDEDPIPF